MRHSIPILRSALPLALAVAGALSAVPRAGAGQGTGAAPAGVAARTFELRPRDGRDAEADAGYRRHLDWHAAAGDPWAWLLWEVVDGPRAGTYVDGTFGHAWRDFDHAVDPAGDGADNARNVEPLVTRGASQAWRLRPELGGATVDPERAPLVLRAEYRVRPEASATFVAALQRLRTSLGRRSFAVYELVSGGERPTYVLWIPAASWAEIGSLLEAAAAAPALAASAAWMGAELWRFRPDLSLCRSAASHCHRTLGAPAAGGAAR